MSDQGEAASAAADQRRTAAGPDRPDGAGKFSIGEDWAAVLAGLVLLALVLSGLIPAGLIP